MANSISDNVTKIVCGSCGGDHHYYQCPTLKRAIKEYHQPPVPDPPPEPVDKPK